MRLKVPKYIVEDEDLGESRMVAYTYLILNTNTYGVFNYNREFYARFLNIAITRNLDRSVILNEAISSLVKIINLFDKTKTKECGGISFDCIDSLDSKVKFGVYCVNFNELNNYRYYGVVDLCKLDSIREYCNNHKISFITSFNFIVWVEYSLQNIRKPIDGLSIKHYLCGYVKYFSNLIHVTNKYIYELEDMCMECKVFYIYKFPKKKYGNSNYLTQPRIYLNWEDRNKTDEIMIMRDYGNGGSGLFIHYD